jgi:hypothetical protein
MTTVGIGAVEEIKEQMISSRVPAKGSWTHRTSSSLENEHLALDAAQGDFRDSV